MTCGVVIVDNRHNIGELQVHIYNHLKKLPKGWNFQIFRPDSIRSLDDYNKLLTSEEFWNSIKFDKVLITQMDAEILRHGIEQFLQYDYIGAPWKFQGHGGNGGFSLRTKKVMLDIIKAFPYEGAGSHGYEDVYFSNHIDKVGGKLAPRSECEKFSVETILAFDTFGAHAIDKYLTPDQCREIRNR